MPRPRAISATKAVCLTGRVAALRGMLGAIMWLGCSAPLLAASANDSFRDCTACPEMVIVPAGSFVMGSPAGERERAPGEGPQRTVRIDAAFAAGKYEVTRAQFAAFAGAVPPWSRSAGCIVFDAAKANFRRDDSAHDWNRPGYPQAGDHPVVCVQWDEAKAYTAWLSRRTGKRYRLLSEAEWEYAARAGSDSPWPWGEDRDRSCAYANLADETFVRSVARGPGRSWYPGWHACRDGFAFTAPVGRFKANRFGLHDMIGNAFEWVEDCWNDSYADAPARAEPRLTGDCALRAYRGGAWRTYSGRSAQRGNGRQPHALIGFRVARTLDNGK